MNFDLQPEILNLEIPSLITGNIELAEQGAGWVKKFYTFPVLDYMKVSLHSQDFEIKFVTGDPPFPCKFFNECAELSKIKPYSQSPATSDRNPESSSLNFDPLLILILLWFC
jgi:hypothetical protein